MLITPLQKATRLSLGLDLRSRNKLQDYGELTDSSALITSYHGFLVVLQHCSQSFIHSTSSDCLGDQRSLPGFSLPIYSLPNQYFTFALPQSLRTKDRRLFITSPDWSFFQVLHIYSRHSSTPRSAGSASLPQR